MSKQKGGNILFAVVVVISLAVALVSRLLWVRRVECSAFTS